ncbi:hypothetical protein ACLMJK_006489 [Lecanora helva]
MHFTPLLLLPLTLLTPSTLSSPLAKRGPGNTQEVVYLSDCDYPSNNTVRSEMNYYFNYTSSGVQPTPPIGTAYLPTLVTWPNSTQFSVFRPLDEQTVQINAGADKLRQGLFAGVANDTAGVYLACFRDGGQVLFETGVKRCRSQYYCIDSATEGLFGTCESKGIA